MAKVIAPYYPIIYVRGYAMTQDAIVETTSTPFMGFEAGSTKMRQARDGSIRKFVFESPLVRLMKDFGYVDIYEAGSERSDKLSPRCVVIHRYYDPADPAFGNQKAPSIIVAATLLAQRIDELRDLICGRAERADADVLAARKAFKVYLVAHSMGGLICRCMLQNPDVGSAEVKAMVDKVFTYATPHNGIDMGAINVPGFLTFSDMSNFNRGTMARYLAIPGEDADQVNTLGDSGFPPERVFCLVGTNSRDYAVAHGLSSFAVGAMSDGLVRIANAYVEGAPRAFVNRSHSGYFGIVNSEEGYQNLVRFLFGNVRASGMLEISAIPFPPDVERACKAGKKVQSSYYIETTVAPRGAYTFDLTCRTRDNGSAVRREYSELFNSDGSIAAHARSPVLFSVFLDTRNILAGSEIAFSIDLAVVTAGYEIDDALIFKTHIPGEYLFRDTLVLYAKADAGGNWSLRYVWSDSNWASGPKNDADKLDVDSSRIAALHPDSDTFRIPVKSDKGFDAILNIAVSGWND